jgi:hypothetical protein
LGATNLELAYRLIPASGNNWGEISHSQAAEAEFLARISPLLHPKFGGWNSTRTGRSRCQMPGSPKRRLARGVPLAEMDYAAFDRE